MNLRTLGPFACGLPRLEGTCRGSGSFRVEVQGHFYRLVQYPAPLSDHQLLDRGGPGTGEDWLDEKGETPIKINVDVPLGPRILGRFDVFAFAGLVCCRIQGSLRVLFGV